MFLHWEGKSVLFSMHLDLVLDRKDTKKRGEEYGNTGIAKLVWISSQE